MKNALLVYNPSSGDHSLVRRMDYIVYRFQQRNVLLQPFRFSGIETESLYKVMKYGSYDFLIVSGGDGTVNAVANVILKNKIDMPLGLFPAGTCNDLARSLSIPSTLDGCIDIILDGRVIEIDVGLINDKQYFLNTCAGGNFIDVSYSTHGELKKNLGPFAYYLKALTEVTNVKSFNIKVTTEDYVLEDEALLFLILNGKHAGGFNNVIKEADISDGMMDIILIRNCSHIDMATLFFKVLSSDVLNDRNVIKLKTSYCIIESDSKVSTSIDGEKGDELPYSVKFCNKALKVFVK